HVIDLTRYTFSKRAILNRFRATKASMPRWLNVVRAVSSEGLGRIAKYTEVRRRLESDPQVRSFFDRETNEIPEFYVDRVRRGLGSLWEWLPAGALNHDPNAHHHTAGEPSAAPVSILSS